MWIIIMPVDGEKMVIGEFNESYPPLMDGVGQVVEHYTHDLNAMGHKAYAIVAGDADAPRYDESVGEKNTIRTRMYALPVVKPYGVVHVSGKVRKEVGRIPFDIVHAHSPFYMGSFAEKVARKRNIPLVSTFHSQFKDDIRGAVHSNLIAHIAVKFLMRHYKKADEVWAPSLGSARVLRGYGYKGEVFVVENACDMPLPDEDEKRMLAEKGLSLIGNGAGSVPILLYVGQLKVEKNIMLILKSLKVLKDSGFPFLMVFVGSGPDRGHMDSYVAKNGLSDYVRFAGKITDREVLKCYYAAASLFLFPSFYDTFGIVKVEAAAFSVPVVFALGSCISEGITDGVNGFVAENEPVAYAEKIVSVLNDKELLEKTGHGARRTLYRSWDMVAAEVEARYKALIEKKRGKIGDASNG